MSTFNWKFNGTNDPAVGRHSRVQLTSAQILALNTTPVALVPAPGVGKYIDVLSVTVVLNFNSIAYTGANALSFNYTSGAGATTTTSSIAAAFLNGGATAAFKTAGADAVTPAVNAPVVASVASANPAAGNSTLTVDILYRIVSA